MLKPEASFSFAVGSLSAAVGSGGGATGASSCALTVSRRPIKGNPGGSTGAGANEAAGEAEADGRADDDWSSDCWAIAAKVNAPRNRPANKRLRDNCTLRLKLWNCARRSRSPRARAGSCTISRHVWRHADWIEFAAPVTSREDAVRNFILSSRGMERRPVRETSVSLAPVSVSQSNSLWA